MNFHQQLRTQYQRFKQSQQTLSQKLQAEAKMLERYLRQALSLDGCYRKSINDEMPTEPYLRLSDMAILSENAELPSLRFKLIVVLDEGEEVYPKEEISQLFELSYLQSDRMVLRFLPPTAANFPFNLGDDANNKFEPFAVAFQQCLLHKLRERK